MSEEKKEEVKTTRSEKRSFEYTNDDSGISFNFDIDVSDKEVALVEIADFAELMAAAMHDLKNLAKQFTPKEKKDEKKEEKKEDKKSKDK